jgi:hypothetical protein
VLFIDFKKAYDSVMREVLCNILEFGVPMNLVGLIKMYSAYSEVRMCERLSDDFLIQNDIKQGDALSPLLFNFRICH